MRKLFTILSAVLVTATVWAQSPHKMSYQAVIRNSGGQLVTDIQIGMEINIRQGSETGTVVYTETQTPTTNSNGLVSIEIGGSGFSTINWASDTYYFETKTAVVAPLTTYTITEVSQLLSVPYALNVKTAEAITPGESIGDLQYWNGTAWVVLSRGASGQVLTLNESNIPVWQNATATALKPPSATIQPATNIKLFSATLNSTVNAYNLSTSVVFEWGLTTEYGNEAPSNPNPVTGTSDVAVNIDLNNLQPVTTYHFRSRATNAANVTYSGDLSFTTELEVGDIYQGGIVAYVVQPCDVGYVDGETHGIIAAPSDQSEGVQWYGADGYTETGANATAIGAGKANTDTIVSKQGAGSYAAQFCSDLDLGGYTDWFLPSKDELILLYLNKDYLGVFINQYYWSSSESTITGAFIQNFGDGGQWYNGDKWNHFPVRAVHAF